jgi:deoxyhypusine synthase
MTDRHESDAEDSEPHTNEQQPRETFCHDPIDHSHVWAGMSVDNLADQYGHAGIGAAAVHDAVDIYTEMLADDDCTVFLSLAGAMVPTGMRRIVSDLIRDGHVDVLVTTGANLTHDTIEAIGGKHHHGDHEHPDFTDREFDEQLRDEAVDRIHNVYLPQEHFTLLEKHLRANVFPPLAEQESVGIAELCAELGRANADQNSEQDVKEDAGIAAAAYEEDVPVYCPAVQDSVLGLQAWMYSQISGLTLDALSDMTPLTDLAYEADTSGCLLVGGGVPKNFTLQTMLVTAGAYEYAVQITMDSAATGGLSGATLDEARSWGKLTKEARNVTVLGDATVHLPLIVAAARERLEAAE